MINKKLLFSVKESIPYIKKNKFIIHWNHSCMFNDSLYRESKGD